METIFLLCCGTISFIILFALVAKIVDGLWVLVYSRRKKLGLPDWLSGILATGVISGLAINLGKGKPKDWGCIIIATLFILGLIACLCTLLTITVYYQ